MNHKIKINNIEVELTEEQIIELHSRLQDKGEKYFFPKKGEGACYICIDGSIEGSTNWSMDNDHDSKIISRGVFKNVEQAKKEDEKRLALVRMWKWVQENGLYWEPDWSNKNKMKNYPAYIHTDKRWISEQGSFVERQFLFPYFKSSEDCQKFIDDNLSDLNLFV